MRGVNKVILVGTLGNDPEVKFLPSGGAVTNISVATSETWKDKNTGQKQEKTEWHKAVFFGKLAEIAGEYLKKASQVYLEGSLRTRKWQNKDGVDMYTTEVVCDEMQMLGGKPEGNQQAAQQQTGMARPAPASNGAQTASHAPPVDPNNFDDIPW